MAQIKTFNSVGEVFEYYTPKNVIKELEDELWRKDPSGYGRYLAFRAFLKLKKINKRKEIEKQIKKLKEFLALAPIKFVLTQKSSETHWGALFLFDKNFALC